MKTGAGISLMLLLLAGCTHLSVDNGKCHANYNSFMKTVDGPKFDVCHTTGQAEKSEVDVLDVQEVLR